MNILNSYAKINLGLEVLGKRSDGFHEISSILCKIDLFDQISFFNSDENQVSQIGINQNENIVFTVLDYMTKKYNSGQKLKIVIDKKIPYSSGMGGGSSNAATAIEGINKILNLNLDSKEKFDIARKFGSDISFFLVNSCAKVSGRGEIIKFINPPKIKDILIFYPIYKLKDKTKKVFNSVSSYTDGNNQKNILDKINNSEYLVAPFFNGLEHAAIENFEDLMSLKNSLRDIGIKNLSMTGAGPTYYSVCSSIDEANKLRNIVDKSGLSIITFQTKIL